MRHLRRSWLVVLLGLGCGGKGDTTAGESSGTDTSTSTGAPATDPGETTQEPTGGSSSTGAESSSSSSSGGAAESSSGDEPACETSAESCGLTVSDVGSECRDPPAEKDALVLEVLGPGSIKMTEIGHIGACNLKFGSEVFIGPQNSIIVNYQVQGEPMGDCVCAHDVYSTLSGLAAGTWTAYVGPYTEMVDVP